MNELDAVIIINNLFEKWVRNLVAVVMVRSITTI
jgi:hypothetical protein